MFKHSLVLLSFAVMTLLAACDGSNSPNDPPPAPVFAITAQPTDVAVVQGNTATFNVTASGTGVSYQWQGSTGAGAAFSNIAAAPASGRVPAPP